MNEKTTFKIILFLVLIMLAPSLYFVFVAGGFLPPIFFLYFIIGGKSEVVSLAWLWLVHLSIYSVMYFVISYAIVELIYRIHDSIKTKVIISSFILVLIFGSLLPIYNIGAHHGGSKSINIIGVYKSADIKSLLPW